MTGTRAQHSVAPPLPSAEALHMSICSLYAAGNVVEQAALSLSCLITVDQRGIKY